MKNKIEESKLKKSVGLRFKKFRIHINKSQEALAAELEVCQSNIARIECGHLLPNIYFQKYLSDKYQLNINWLINGNDKMILPREKTLTIPGSPILFFQIDENDPRSKKYSKLISLMQIPSIEQIIFGKMVEIQIIFKKEIKSFYDNLSSGNNQSE